MGNNLKPEIKRAIEDALGISNLLLSPLENGTNDRTFFANTERGQFVVRIEQGDGLQLRRAYNAQKRAETLGVCVARVVAHNFESDCEDSWIVEERVEGGAFYPDQMNDQEARATAMDLGRQLKILHSVEVDMYGLLPPFPYSDNTEWKNKNTAQFELEIARNGPIFDSFSEYLDFKAKDIEPAFEAASLDKEDIPRVRDVYEKLKTLYNGGPRFCEGDTATTNLVVKGGKVRAIIDWEWAQASDPADNVAYWQFWNNDPKYLEYLLEGYQPDNREAFKERVLLYQITTAIHLIKIMKDIGQECCIKGYKDKLESILRGQI